MSAVLNDDYEMTQDDLLIVNDLQRFESHARDAGIFSHLPEGRQTYTPLTTAWAPHWRAASNPVGWPTFKPLAHRDVAVTLLGTIGEAADWCDAMKFRRQPLIVATPVEVEPVSFETGIRVSYVLRFENQKDAALFRLVWSHRVGP